MSAFRIIAILLAAVVTSSVCGQLALAEELDPEAGFNETVNSLFDSLAVTINEGEESERTLRYRLFVPEGAESTTWAPSPNPSPADGGGEQLMATAADGGGEQEGWPLIVWLHGLGEAGDDNELHLRWMENVFHWFDHERTYPAFVLAYQCPHDSPNWTSGPAGRATLGNCRAVIDDVIARYPIDVDRIYVAGVSSGGSGTWQMVDDYPELFAAALPMASGGHGGGNLARLVDVPIWSFHVRNDPMSSIEPVRTTVRELRALGGKVWLTEVPGKTHDCWSMSMAADQFNAVGWLLAQRKGAVGPEPPHRKFGITWALFKQDVAGAGVQYYLVIPAIVVGFVWVARRQWRQAARRSLGLRAAGT
jgi:predicted peptidase